MPIPVVDVHALARNWWALLIRGIAAVAFGALTFTAPGISLVTLVLVFGAYSFADGVFALVAAVRQRERRDPWSMLVVEGLVGIGAGALAIFYPGLTAGALLYLVAGWAVITGGLEIALAIRMRKVITNEWLLALSGVASIGFGVVLVLFPIAGALALVLWLGAYAMVFGALLVGLSFKLRSWGRSHDTPHGALPPHGTEHATAV